MVCCGWTPFNPALKEASTPLPLATEGSCECNNGAGKAPKRSGSREEGPSWCDDGSIVIDEPDCKFWTCCLPGASGDPAVGPNCQRRLHQGAVSLQTEDMVRRANGSNGKRFNHSRNDSVLAQAYP